MLVSALGALDTGRTTPPSQRQANLRMAAFKLGMEIILLCRDPFSRIQVEQYLFNEGPVGTNDIVQYPLLEQKLQVKVSPQ